MREAQAPRFIYGVPDEDVAALRRAMVSHGLMARERGVYWRVLENEEAGPTGGPA